ncbi:MAG: PIG-L deacetylase family protein [Candidatus Thorarchaeota archaeon]
MAKIVFFQPHPDDLEFNCGHLIHFLSTKSVKGHSIKIASITKGEYGLPSFKYDKFKGDFLAKIRTMELYSALSIHRIKPDCVRFFGYIDGFVKFNLDLIKKITQYLKEEKPDIIFAPEALYTWYQHKDHVNTGKALFYIIKNKLIEFKPKLYYYGTLFPNFLFGFKKEDFELINNLLACHKTQYWLLNRLKLTYKFTTRRAALKLRGWNYAEKYRRVYFLPSCWKKNNPPFVIKMLTHWYCSMPWFKAKYPKEILIRMKKAI